MQIENVFLDLSQKGVGNWVPAPVGEKVLLHVTGQDREREKGMNAGANEVVLPFGVSVYPKT